MQAQAEGCACRPGSCSAALRGSVQSHQIMHGQGLRSCTRCLVPQGEMPSAGSRSSGAARGQHGDTHLSLAPDGREFCRTDRGAVPSPAATCNGGDTASEKHRAEVDQNQVLFPFRFMQAGPFWLPSCALTLGTRSPGQTIAMVQFQTGFPIQVVFLFLSGHTDRGNLWRP